jgi:hypothetical protein
MWVKTIDVLIHQDLAWARSSSWLRLTPFLLSLGWFLQQRWLHFRQLHFLPCPPLWFKPEKSVAQQKFSEQNWGSHPACFSPHSCSTAQPERTTKKQSLHFSNVPWTGKGSALWAQALFCMPSILFGITLGSWLRLGEEEEADTLGVEAWSV